MKLCTFFAMESRVEHLNAKTRCEIMIKFSKSMMFLLMTSTDKNYVQTSNFASPTRNKTRTF